MRIFVADPGIRAEQIEAIRGRLPAGWTLAEDATGAAAIVTENVDVTPAMVAAAGDALRLVARLDTGSAHVPEDVSVPVADAVGSTSAVAPERSARCSSSRLASSLRPVSTASCPMKRASCTRFSSACRRCFSWRGTCRRAVTHAPTGA